MRYSYEFKLMCVELYHSGLYPDIPEDTKPDTLKRHIREWSGLVDFFILGSFVGRPFLLSTNPLYPCNLYLCTH